MQAVHRATTIAEMNRQRSLVLLLMIGAVLGGFFVVYHHAAGKPPGALVSTSERGKKARLGPDLASQSTSNVPHRRAREMKGLDKKTPHGPFSFVQELPYLPIPSYDPPDQQALGEVLGAEAASAGVALSSQEIEAAESARLAAVGMTPEEGAAVAASPQQGHDDLQEAATSPGAEVMSAGVALSSQEIEAAESARLAALGMTPEESAAVAASLQQAHDHLEEAATSAEAEVMSAGVALSSQEIEAAESARLAALGMTPEESAAVAASLQQAHDHLQAAATSAEAEVMSAGVALSSQEIEAAESARLAALGMTTEESATVSDSLQQAHDRMEEAATNEAVEY